MHITSTIIKAITGIDIHHAIHVNAKLSPLALIIWLALCMYITAIQLFTYINHYICNYIIQTLQPRTTTITAHKPVSRGIFGSARYTVQQFNDTYLPATADTIQHIYQHNTQKFNNHHTITADTVTIKPKAITTQYKAASTDSATSPLQQHEPLHNNNISNKISKSTSMSQFTPPDPVATRIQSSSNAIPTDSVHERNSHIVCKHLTPCDCKEAGVRSNSVTDTPIAQPKMIVRDESSSRVNGFASPLPVHTKSVSQADTADMTDQLNAMLIGAVSNKHKNNNAFTPSKLAQTPPMSRIGSYAHSNARSSLLSGSNAYSTTQLVKEILSNSSHSSLANSGSNTPRRRGSSVAD